MADSTTAATQNELVIEREFNAPRDVVWRAWTEPEHVMRWWGPEHYSCPMAKADLRVGGRYIYAMRGPDGTEHYSAGEYLELDPPKRFVATDYFSDSEGNKINASTLGLPGDWPDELIVTATFDELPDGKTKLKIRQAGMPPEMRADASAGWGTSLDKLAALVEELAGKQS